jgi:hypothetical protein
VTGPAGLTGTVNLVMPASTWLGLAHAPGEIAGTGSAGARTCRDLAAALAARGDSRWCLTLTDPNGRAVAHGCARAGPGPPGTPDPAAWLRQIAITPIEAGTCGPPPGIGRIPALSLVTAPDQDPQSPVRLPRLPPPGHPHR